MADGFVREALGVIETVLDHQVALDFVVEQLLEMLGQFVFVVWRDIDAALASAFLKTASGGGNDGNPTR